MNLFEIASRKKFRFPSERGELTVEDLWVLPLSSGNTLNLDSVAKNLNRQLKAQQEESFVSTTANTAQTVLEQKLELVKYVISVKLDEAEKARTRAERAEERKQLLEILDEKNTEKLRGMSTTQLRKRIEALSEDE